MRGKLVWGAVAVVAVVGLEACGGDKAVDQSRPSPFSKDKFEITRTACTAGQTEFDVDSWAVSTTPGATVKWINGNGDAVVTITPKNSGQWPFDDKTPVVLQPRTTVERPVSSDNGNKNKKFRFIIQISCGGTPGHVVKIDPDIFVD